MGELLLCSHALASVPYYVDSIALNVYSLEELCYYLKQNIDLVDPSFMDGELISWIEAELKLPALAKQLRRRKEEGCGLSEFAAILAGGCNYCTKDEIAAMHAALSEFKDKSETECRKIRADRLLLKKRYSASILEYRKLLELPGVGGTLAGNIYHNLGTAYAALFFFEEAAACYGKAFERNRNEISQKQQQAALQLAEGKAAFENDKEESGVFPEGQLEEWKEAYYKNCK